MARGWLVNPTCQHLNCQSFIYYTLCVPYGTAASMFYTRYLRFTILTCADRKINLCTPQVQALYPDADLLRRRTSALRAH